MSDAQNKKKRHVSRRGRLRRLLPRLARSRDGAAAIEFALLAIPYFVIVFAIFETFIAFTGEQLVSNAVDTMARKLRTGQITAASSTEPEFRRAFCAEVSILISCSESEINVPSKLYLDIRSFPDFASIPKNFTLLEEEEEGEGSDLDTSTFQYNPGGPSTINMLRAYYKWQVITDLVRPYISNIKLGTDGSNSYFLIMATAAYKNEAFPQ
ncbi:pilus assembly protein [Rhizobiaceae bacterium BDR2-2]|uniref:Pilus assembly protein n=1 Tax=Ectorhizobium quercum TaxID=2965071 RepID=A0AAE3MWM2_9HYPH|nr:TadE/TadG family type IV pilus assembly protein [Ectorhizobium quercum]MCX8995682.1 pilus assembly protein [Ectorhizobium quercum]